MSMSAFNSTLQDINGWKIICIPMGISIDFPSRGMVMVKATINGYPILAPLEPDGMGSHWLHVENTLLDELTLQVGDDLFMRTELLDDWIEPAVPADLLESIQSHQLMDQWNTLTTKARWDWLRWIRSTKNMTTRNKRMGVMCSKLSSGDRRPCCFNRNICTVTDVSRSGLLIKP